MAAEDKTHAGFTLRRWAQRKRETRSAGGSDTAAAEPVNPKVRRPKVVPNCTYKGFKDGKPVAATVQFRWGKTDAEAQHAFDEARMQFQTKPMLISGSDAFWSAKTGQMNVRKGRTWLTIAVGPDKLSERDLADAKKLAELLVQKL